MLCIPVTSGQALVCRSHRCQRTVHGWPHRQLMMSYFYMKLNMCSRN